jgi:peptidoglycan lytic transglycosylase
VRSLQYGTRYLRQMIDRFGGRVERALAAYNAGASRVVAWTAARPDMSAEEFIETIPFTETRSYVMGVLAHREHYRRLYALPGPSVQGAPTTTAQ